MGQELGISGMHIDVTTANAVSIDSQIASLLNDYSSSFDASKTVVLHLVVEQEDADEADADANAQNGNNGYYGYGYYNAYGEWVTPYKSMFQIQYFNVVLWTSLGLVAVLF